MFPGQSSRYPAMIDRLVEAAPDDARPLLAEASEVLHRDLREHYRADNPAIFATNRDVQIGVFLASHIHLAALSRAGGRGALSLGLSLGEYNHLVHIGAIDFGAAIALVDARGAAYDAGPAGAMASVFPLDIDDLREVVRRVEGSGPLEIANLNSPTQHVLSGARAAIDAARSILDDEHGVECVLIEERIPMHASMFAPVAEALRPALERAPWRTPSAPYLPNVLGRFEDAPRPERIASLLARHVHGPVLFRTSIELCAAHAPDAVFVEVGPRSVLFNLLSRKWIARPRFKTDVTGSPVEWATALEATAKEISDGR
jgi:[acyl-carrier-protein] S-malonyltransferase